MTITKVLALTITAAVFVFCYFNTPRKKSEVFTAPYKGPSHPLIHFDKETFYKGVNLAGKENKRFNYHVSGGIIPHHLLPGFIIADFFSRLSFQSPKTIIIIGPNHEEAGDYKALTSNYGWETPFGVVSPATDLINVLVENNLVRIDEKTLPLDHAAAGSMSFIKYYLPNSKVVPILLSGTMNNNEVEVLADGLSEHLNEDTLIIAAVDFSHYLPSWAAVEKDEETLKVMNNFNFARIMTLSNDYMDSPEAISVLLLAMQKKGTINSEILYHTNSGEIMKNKSEGTTSYFSIAYY